MSLLFLPVVVFSDSQLIKLWKLISKQNEVSTLLEFVLLQRLCILPVQGGESMFSSLAEPGLGAPLSSYLEGALYKLIYIYIYTYIYIYIYI